MRKLLPLCLLGLSACSSLVTPPEHQARLVELSEQYQLPLETLEAAYHQSEYRQEIIDAITRPWEAKPWHQYQALFNKPERTEAGLAFWREHEDTLARAEETFGVPAQIIVAIIGVETYYGRFTGRHSVRDALYTLGFHYPARSSFFSREFAQFIKLAEQQDWQLGDVKGSYAGAMGLGQFISSSYLHYGVDFDNDGTIDMLTNPTDAIGSVANYFKQHKWQYGQSVVHKALTNDEQAAPWLSKKLPLEHTWQQLREAGIQSDATLDDKTPVKLLQLEEAQGHSYWLVRDNFYVITRYNHSPLYAMAVYEFSERLRQGFSHGQ